MKANRVQIREEAREDKRQAFIWYNKNKEGLGEKFLGEVENVLQLIWKSPEAFPFCKKSLRQVSLKKFPYVVIYDFSESDLTGYAVFHTHLNLNKKP